MTLRLHLIALAAALACGSALAQSEEPANAIGFGGGLVFGDRADRARFGEHNGLRDASAALGMDLRLTRRDDAAGTTLRLDAHAATGGLGALEATWRQPGDWRLVLQASRQSQDDPRSPSTGADLRLSRTALGVALRKSIGENLQVDVSLASEDKAGARLFGIGMTCPSAVAPGCQGSSGIATGWALLLLPQPVDANHTQLEARVSWAAGPLRLNAGYLGSFYRNRLDTVSATVPATLVIGPLTQQQPSTGLAAILARPVALAPDNESQQIDVGGMLHVSPTTQVNFRLARAVALQHQDFAASGFTDGPAGVANLDGEVVTVSGQLGFSARPVPRLTLLGKVSVEDRDDRTPLAPYNIEGTTTYTNHRLPATKARALLQANWQFTPDLRGTLAANQESIDRGVLSATSAVSGLTALRQQTDETGLRAELRQRISEDLSGSVVFATSRRHGSNWLRDNSGLGVTEVTNPNDPATGFANGIFMPTLADRQRDTLRLTADWQAGEDLAFQASAMAGHDGYDTPSAYGLRKSGTAQIEFDGSWAISERWNVVGNLSWGTQSLRQARPDAAIVDWDNRSAGVSLGITGRPKSGFEVGASLALVEDRSTYAQTLLPGASAVDAALLAATGGLPDIVFRQTLVKAFGAYKPTKASEFRLDLVHQRSTWTDWAWSYNGAPFTYSDGSTVLAPARQAVTFLGLRYTYRWN